MVLVTNKFDAVALVLTLKASADDAVAANEAEVTEPVMKNEAVDANEAEVTELVMNRDAVSALVAHEDVPIKVPVSEPVNDPVTLEVDPVTTIASAAYVPILTVSLENASITGIPEMSFTAKSEPERESVTENNWP